MSQEDEPSMVVPWNKLRPREGENMTIFQARQNKVRKEQGA